MLWLVLSLMTALSVALRDVSIRAFEDLSGPDAGLLEMAWVLPLLLAIFPFVPRPDLDRTFWMTFIVAVPIDVVAYLIYLKAIKVSPISLTVPFLSLTPLFMTLTGLLVLGESVSLMGGLGILLIASGSYVLHLNRLSEGFHAPFLAILREKGSVLMMVVAFLFAFGGVLGKKAILHSSPLYFSYLYHIVLAVLTGGLLLLSGQASLSRIRHHPLKGMWLGTLFFIHITCHGLAIRLVTAAYMIAVKRTSVLFSILLSGMVLKEEHLKIRGTGALLMFMGAVVIIVYG